MPEALKQKQLKRWMKARYIKSHSEEDKKAYQQARNIYLLKLKKIKMPIFKYSSGEYSWQPEEVVWTVGFPN